jgi:hypothetical protein
MRVQVVVLGLTAVGDEREVIIKESKAIIAGISTE